MENEEQNLNVINILASKKRAWRSCHYSAPSVECIWQYILSVLYCTKLFKGVVLNLLGFQPSWNIFPNFWSCYLKSPSVQVPKIEGRNHIYQWGQSKARHDYWMAPKCIISWPITNVLKSQTDVRQLDENDYDDVQTLGNGFYR